MSNAVPSVTAMENAAPRSSMAASSLTKSLFSVCGMGEPAVEELGANTCGVNGNLEPAFWLFEDAFVQASEAGFVEVEHRPANRLIGWPLVPEAYLVPELGVALEMALHPAVRLARVCLPKAQHDQRSRHELQRAPDPCVCLRPCTWASKFRVLALPRRSSWLS